MSTSHDLDPRKTPEKETDKAPPLGIEEVTAELGRIAGAHIGNFFNETEALGLLPPIPDEDRKKVTDKLTGQAGIIHERDGDVSDVRAYATAVDPSVAELEKRAAELHHLATHDGLTKVLNRYGLDEYLSRYDDPQALLYVDLTNFKKVNDKISHTRGDMLLVDMATLLKGVCRRFDEVARVGGDEFVVVLSDKGALEKSEEGGDRSYDVAKDGVDDMLNVLHSRLNKAIEDYLDDPLNSDVKAQGFHMAVGAMVWEKGSDLKETLHEAEEAMKLHKDTQHENLGQYRP